MVYLSKKVMEGKLVCLRRLGRPRPGLGRIESWGLAEEQRGGCDADNHDNH